ncbi:hypothetical protein A0J57_23545 [Sphingobium sp. 22B]|jgi:hypothetical protein|uniref:Kiwa anti-phage protein KwaB-like domain-containing protein n=1 Tax=Sphingomonadales TaxID=204457 RepID=UPI0007853333|nr:MULTISPECIES: Kiwa anti-phage protein KwaB-like domain-containing protein [unclassified Sphingobium]KXU29575.1 hypothetical protein AXW74_22315 [Sphingobium sp. AM]KYC29853.1 hypothetical protein A0J57_23545 [Sphingobium sp. 22B]OAP29461.1 hypothetical protein A8O16_23540 [Sphingobium sp. 20006FA]
MVNLFALCRLTTGLQVKRVALAQPVQAKVGHIFQTQANYFLNGVAEEVDFSGDWKPDDDELLVIDAPAEAAVITATIAANPISLPEIDAQNFMAEGIRGLFVIDPVGQGHRVLIQAFSAQQLLSRRFTLFQSGNSFKELTEPGFTLDNSIVAIMEGGKLKFKSFQRTRSVFDLQQFYKAATDQEVDAFCQHASLEVADVAAFKVAADQGVRKLVHAITKANVLNTHQVDVIATKAASLGINITVQNGKLLVPTDRKSIKTLFRFLDDGIYQAALSASRYVTNSKRRIP